MNLPRLFRLEWVLIAAIGAQFLFMGFLGLFGSWTVDPDSSALVVAVLFGLPAVLGIGAVLLLLRRNPLGAFLSMLLHALQLVQWTFDNGASFNFSFFPTVTLRLGPDKVHPVEINLLAVLLTLLSLAAWGMRRKANLAFKLERSPHPG